MKDDLQAIEFNNSQPFGSENTSLKIWRKEVRVWVKYDGDDGFLYSTSCSTVSHKSNALGQCVNWRLFPFSLSLHRYSWDDDVAGNMKISRANMKISRADKNVDKDSAKLRAFVMIHQEYKVR